MQYLFIENNPEGSLKDGEVMCKLFKDNKDILVDEVLTCIKSMQYAKI